jgi:ABC-type transport system involved in Fe-S cluster assembly fused permease/ATPase subunit
MRGRESTYGVAEQSHFKTLKTLAPYLWPVGRGDLKVRVVIALVLLTAAKVINVYVPFLYKHAIDALAPAKAGGVTAAIFVPVGLIISYGLARIMSQAFGELRDAVFAKVGQSALRQVALETFRHMHNLSLRFHLERRTGGLSRAIERGTKGIDFLLRFTLFNILPTLLEIVLVCGVLLAKFNAWFAAITFISVVGYIVFTLLITEWRTKFRREMNARDSQANTKAIDSLLNFETVKYFNNEDHEARRYDEALAGYENAAVKSQVTLSLLNIGQGAIISVGLVIVMVMAAKGVKDGSLSIGDFVLVNSLLLQLFMPLNFLGFVYREIKSSLVDMEYMFRLLEQETEIRDAPGAQPLRPMGGEIIFDHVSFFYNPDRQILKDVSFRVPAGHSLAIVGASGAGKSTISRILFRFYEIAGGSVRIDGQDIREVRQKSLRQAIGIVPQDTVLFNDTIRYNIRYGKPDATDHEVEEAARLARIHDFVISLPQGYDTQVGERGLKLSGGEKQRVAIARTILKNPRVLLLDEATSALDTHTEREIQASLESVSRGRTTLIIAHRLSTVVNADEIIVLDQGTVAERGSHDALLDKQGLYAAMWARQQEAEAARSKLSHMEEPSKAFEEDASLL